MHPDTIYPDRSAAGRALALALEHLKGFNGIVLAIPRGGVPVAKEVALHLSMPLDILLSKKIGHPSNPEFAIGAVTAEDCVVNTEKWPDPQWLEDETERIRTELAAKRHRLKGDQPDLPLRDRTVIIVDDGIATGNTIRATLPMIRRRHPARIVIATPVAPRATCLALKQEVDEFVVLQMPVHFSGVGAFYDDFTQVEDVQVAAILKEG